MYLLLFQLRAFHDPENVVLILICRHRWNRAVVKIYTAKRWPSRHLPPARNPTASPKLDRHFCRDVRRRKFCAEKL